MLKLISIIIKNLYEKQLKLLLWVRVFLWNNTIVFSFGNELLKCLITNFNYV